MKNSAANIHRVVSATGSHRPNTDLGAPSCIGYRRADNRISSLGEIEGNTGQSTSLNAHRAKTSAAHISGDGLLVKLLLDP